MSVAPPSSATDTLRLRNGVEMPFLGLGTSHNGGYSHDAVVVSLRHGLRAIDTATRYGCESQIADAIAASGVRRADVFITTKLFYDDYGYDNAIRSVEASLARLRTDYIDLYLLHWPGTPSTAHNRQIRADTWRALVHLYSVGKVRSIGVSNFLQSHLEQLQADSLASGISERPHVNQVECHCFNHPVQLIAYCRQQGIAFEGYCPLAKGQLLIEPIIVDMAKLYACTPAQLCIRWNLQHGYICIPKSTKPERVVENACVFFFSITPGDMTKLDALHDGRHVTWDPTNVP